MRAPKLVGGALLVAATALAACEAGVTPTATESPAIRAATVTINGVRLLERLPGRHLEAASSALATVTPGSGGTVALADGSLSVPAGAVGETVTITMEADPELHAYAFGPSGLEFRSPATLTISVDEATLRDAGIDPDRLAVAGASDDEDDWTAIGGSYDDGAVTASLHHFSRYGLILR